MNKIFINIKKIIVTSTIFFATLSSPLNANPKVLKIGAIPDQNQEVLDKRFNLFAKELAKTLDVKVSIFPLLIMLLQLLDLEQMI